MTIRQVNLAAYPQVIQVQAGDIIRATTEFDYVGPALSGTIYTALWNWTLIDPHNEIAHGTKSFSLPLSPEPGKHIAAYVDIIFPYGYSKGLHYGLYTKIMGVPGEPRTEYYADIIELTEAAPPEERFILRLRADPFLGGKITKDPYKSYYNKWEVVKLTAIPYSGYRFFYFTVDDQPPDFSNPMNLAVTSEHTITAYFGRI